VLGQVLGGQAQPTQIAALVVALRAKGESVGEMTGFVRAMVAHSVPLPLPAGVDVIDTCGTGGDRLRSINVSTIAALVVAATGARVCKHGGRASSSAVGAADVLEALGAVADLGPHGVARCLEEVGLGFCFAPRFHPAMRYAAPVRKELGIPTVFNFLGPLANPGRAKYQVVGVSDPAMADKMLGVLEANGAKRVWIVYGDDGLDELSTTGPSTVHELQTSGAAVAADDPDPGTTPTSTADTADRAAPAAAAAATATATAGASLRTTFRIDPAELGFPLVTIDDLRGGDAAYNAQVIRRVVAGDASPHRDIAVLNAAASLVVVGKATDLKQGVDLAGSVIDDGGAARVLDGFIRLTREAAGPD
jgi:anthranilate phosphoribosyltransferase